MQPNAFILPGGSEREPARATGEDRPLPFNSADGVGGGGWRRLMGRGGGGGASLSLFAGGEGTGILHISECRHHNSARGQLEELGWKSIPPLKMLPGSSALYECMTNRWPCYVAD